MVITSNTAVHLKIPKALKLRCGLDGSSSESGSLHSGSSSGNPGPRRRRRAGGTQGLKSNRTRPLLAIPAHDPNRRSENPEPDAASREWPPPCPPGPSTPGDQAPAEFIPPISACFVGSGGKGGANMTIPQSGLFPSYAA